MRVESVVCPACSSRIKSQNGIPVGLKINCPKCQKPFVVPQPAKDDTDVVMDVELIPVDSKPAAKVKPRPQNEDDDEDEDEDTDDEQEEMEDRRAAKKKKKKPSGFAKAKHNPFIRVPILVILITVMCVLGYMLYQKQKQDQENREWNEKINRGEVGEK